MIYLVEVESSLVLKGLCAYLIYGNPSHKEKKVLFGILKKMDEEYNIEGLKKT